VITSAAVVGTAILNLFGRSVAPTNLYGTPSATSVESKTAVQSGTHKTGSVYPTTWAFAGTLRGWAASDPRRL
jgi:hypothetical protein